MANRRPTRLLEVVLLLALGGFAGATLRHAVALALPGLAGTLAVNAAGSLALGALVAEARFADRFAESTHLVAGAGFLSSFTTYSTFVVQSVGAPAPLLVANVVATYALGFAGAFAGRVAVRRAANGAGPAIEGGGN
ncbi:MAG: CrcB family protein [Halobacteriales archaeon]